MMMAATVTPVVLKEREREKEKKKSLPLCTYPPPGSFHPIFLTLSVEKVRRKKNGVLILLWLWESTRRRRMESLVLFFFYCVPTTLLVPPHLTFLFFFLKYISWQGEWLAQKEEVEKRTDLSFSYVFPLLYTCKYARKKHQKLLPLTFFPPLLTRKSV